MTFIKGSIPWNKGKQQSKEVREKRSKAMKGIIPWNKGGHISEVTRAKLSVLNSGEKNHFFGKHFSRELNSAWKGDKANYRTKHQWMINNFGKPSLCEHCHQSFTGHKIHWANKTHKYLRVRSDWIRLCASCHWAFDVLNGFRKH